MPFEFAQPSGMVVAAIDWLIASLKASRAVLAPPTMQENTPSPSVLSLLPSPTAPQQRGDYQFLRKPPFSLTPAEHGVIVLVLDGLRNKEVARRLDISPRTVEVHRGRAMEKIGARNIADLFRQMLPYQDSATGPGERPIDRTYAARGRH